jgi:type II secretory pathway pseudopilin PulG
LIEVLVALAITGLVLGALMQAYSSGLRTLAKADRQQNAVLIAASLLEETAAMKLKPGSDAGRIEEFEWRRDVEETALEDTPALSEQGWRPFAVTVTVSWGEEHALTLRTMRLGKGR